MPKTKIHNKRYNLSLPQNLYDELDLIAEKKQTNIADIIRSFIKLGMIVNKLEDDPNASFIIRENDKEREIILL